VVVVPFFISDGLHSYQDIPAMLGIEPGPTAATSERTIFRRNPHQLQGRALYYASAIGTEPQFAEIIVAQARAFDNAALDLSPIA
jgi:sirohydrochlorin cobaltochelatase